jgi:ATP-dependent Clp protease ATP-binding subunit ClpA
MWQRFTERAKKAVYLAQKEAAQLGENPVCTQHLLLALLRDDSGLAMCVLFRLGISFGSIRREINGQFGPIDRLPGPEMQLSERFKGVLELAFDEARLLDTNYIGTEHLLLALLRERDGRAGQVLGRLGLDLDEARKEAKRLQEFEATSHPGLRPVQHEHVQAVDPDRDLDFDAVMAKYETRIYDLIYRRIGNEEKAEELTVETFTFASRYFDRFRGDTNLYTWLFQIARNRIRRQNL